MENTIQTEGLVVEEAKKRYGRIEALRGVSLKVHKGEIFGLLGANGAGKTTLIKILVGAARPDGGTVSVLGLNPMKDAYKLRRKIGYMPQAPALYDDLSPRDNMRFFARAHNHLDNLEKRIDEVLDFVDLRSRERDPVHGFSGGMKQRLSLACALVHRPQLLLLDEPTAGVDPKLRELLWQHFDALAAEGVTILVSTHQMDEAQHCNRVAVMREGVVLASDTPRGLLSRGRTCIKIWCNGQVQEEVVSNYPEQLPRLLQRYSLDSAISRVEVEESTLEDIVLNLINTREDVHA
jgi:ABC-2 type transport system ATP-binding protein